MKNLRGDIMLFHAFNSQEERRKYGGSAFVEIQFCKMKSEAKIQNIIAVSSINHWQDDSLYIYLDDTESFVKEYSNIFDCGIFNNLRSGVVDIYGINYYKPDLVEIILSRILRNKPADYEVLIEWLKKAQRYNGFYILGI